MGKDKTYLNCDHDFEALVAEDGGVTFSVGDIYAEIDFTFEEVEALYLAMKEKQVCEPEDIHGSWAEINGYT